MCVSSGVWDSIAGANIWSGVKTKISREELRSELIGALLNSVLDSESVWRCCTVLKT